MLPRSVLSADSGRSRTLFGLSRNPVRLGPGMISTGTGAGHHCRQATLPKGGLIAGQERRNTHTYINPRIAQRKPNPIRHPLQPPSTPRNTHAQGREVARGFPPPLRIATRVAVAMLRTVLEALRIKIHYGFPILSILGLSAHWVV